MKRLKTKYCTKKKMQTVPDDIKEDFICIITNMVSEKNASATLEI